MLNYDGHFKSDNVVDLKDVLGFIFVQDPIYASNWEGGDRKTVVKFANDQCEAAGVGPFDEENDMLLQLCLVYDENEVEHFMFFEGLNMEDNTDLVHVMFSPKQSFIPLKVFKGLEEGDTITLSFPGKFYMGDDELGGSKLCNVVVNAEITLGQKNTGFTRHGNFGDTIRYYESIADKKFDYEIAQ